MDYLEHRGLAVLGVDSAIVGIELARERRPDAIVMDGGLPGLSGWAATKLLKAEAATAPIPILMLTAHVFPEAEARAHEAGVDVFLRKPLLPDQLYEEITRVLGAKHVYRGGERRKGTRTPSPDRRTLVGDRRRR